MRKFMLLWLFGLQFCSCQMEKNVDADFRDQVLMNAIGEDFLFNISMQKNQIPSKLSLRNTNKESSLVAEDFFASEKLFFYFESVHCNSCVENELQLLKTIFSKDEVVLWTKLYSPGAIEVFRKVHQIPFEIWTLEKDVEFPRLVWNRPFYFKIREDGSLKYVYSPKFSYLELSEAYLRAIKMNAM